MMAFDNKFKKIEYKIELENIRLEILLAPNGTGAKFTKFTTIPHNHSYNELFICLADDIEIRTDSEPYILRKNDIVVIPPLFEHYLKKSEQSEISHIVIGFTFTKRNGNFENDIYSSFHKTYHGKGPVIVNSDELTNSFKDVIENKHERSPIHSSLNFLTLLYSITEKINKEAFDSEFVSPTPQIDRMATLEHLISSRYMEQLTLKQVAEELYLSERQLRRIVFKRYGKTLKKVIMEKRLKTAEKMLRLSDDSITEIAYIVGFKDSGIFCREFKEKYGLTPIEYKKSRT